MISSISNFSYKHKLSVLLVLFTLALNAQSTETMLLGEISFNELQKAPYDSWYTTGQEEYEVDESKMDALKKALDSIEITVFMGTWCSDSQREVPRFYKIMEATGYPMESIRLIAVDRDKTTPKKLEEGHDIKRVPTFIFYKWDEKGGIQEDELGEPNTEVGTSKVEVGRIVEYPIKSLETDMLDILSGADYIHAYANQ